jgi:hypothetical protein
MIASLRLQVTRLEALLLLQTLLLVLGGFEVGERTRSKLVDGQRIGGLLKLVGEREGQVNIRELTILVCFTLSTIYDCLIFNYEG